MPREKPTGAYSADIEERLMRDLLKLDATELTGRLAAALINERRRLAREVQLLRIVLPANRTERPERNPHA